MTRFDATDPVERHKLVAEAIRAHRERASPYLTLEVDAETVTANNAVGEPPWVQFSEDVLNLDVTDEERERLNSLLADFPAFKVRQLEQPETSEGHNVRIGALADATRVAQFVERVFVDVYELPGDYQLWLVEV